MARRSDGFTLIELLIVVAIVGVIAAIAAPGLLRARMSGNEVSAVGSLRAINAGQANFAANCGQGTYADSLEGLATPPVSGGEPFINDALSVDPARKSGYIVTVVGGEEPSRDLVICNDTSTAVTYYATAEPISVGGSGTRYFFTNSGTIWHHNGPIEPVQTGTPATGTPIQ